MSVIRHLPNNKEQTERMRKLGWMRITEHQKIAAELEAQIETARKISGTFQARLIELEQAIRTYATAAEARIADLERKVGA